jgi:hypothetical protein
MLDAMSRAAAPAICAPSVMRRSRPSALPHTARSTGAPRLAKLASFVRLARPAALDDSLDSDTIVKLQKLLAKFMIRLVGRIVTALLLGWNRL